MGNILKKIRQAVLSLKMNFNSLIRFHAFTGNNYMSSFYRKGKILQGSSTFQITFAILGNDLNISDDLLTKLE